MNNKNILAALVVALSFIGFFVLILPAYDNIQAAREILQQRKERYAERSVLIQKVASFNEQYQQNIAAIGKLDGLLPTTKHQDEIVSSIQVIAEQSGMNLTELGIADSPGATDESYKSSLISLRISGQYQQFFGFLQLLEQSLRLYDVQSMNISEGQSTSGTGGQLLSFDIKINVNSIK